MLIVLWVIAGLLASNIILRIWGIAIMQEISDALTALNTAITNLQSRAGGVLTPAQAAQVATSIRTAAGTLDTILPAQ